MFSKLVFFLNYLCKKHFQNQSKFTSKYPKVSLVTFFTYVYTGDDHILTAEKAFVCLTLFDIIRMPLAMLPLLIVYMIEVKYFELNAPFIHTKREYHASKQRM